MKEHKTETHETLKPKLVCKYKIRLSDVICTFDQIEDLWKTDDRRLGRE